MGSDHSVLSNGTKEHYIDWGSTQIVHFLTMEYCQGNISTKIPLDSFEKESYSKPYGVKLIIDTEGGRFISFWLKYICYKIPITTDTLGQFSC